VIRQAAGLVMANYEGTTMGWKLGVAEVGAAEQNVDGEKVDGG